MTSFNVNEGQIRLKDKNTVALTFNQPVQYNNTSCMYVIDYSIIHVHSSDIHLATTKELLRFYVRCLARNARDKGIPTKSNKFGQLDVSIYHE